MNVKLFSLAIAVIVTISIGCVLPLTIDHFSDNAFNNITLSDEPLLVRALRDVQGRGAHLCVHGWRHENFTALTPREAEQLVKKGIEVFN